MTVGHRVIVRTTQGRVEIHLGEDSDIVRMGRSKVWDALGRVVTCVHGKPLVVQLEGEPMLVNLGIVKRVVTTTVTR